MLPNKQGRSQRFWSGGWVGGVRCGARRFYLKWRFRALPQENVRNLTLKCVHFRTFWISWRQNAQLTYHHSMHNICSEDNRSGRGQGRLPLLKMAQFPLTSTTPEKNYFLRNLKTKMILFAKKLLYKTCKHLPKIGHGAAAPVVDWDRCRWGRGVRTPIHPGYATAGIIVDK